MITRSSTLLHCSAPDEPGLPAPGGWQRQLAGAIRDPRELCRRLGLDASLIPGAEAGHSLFEVRVPEAFAARMRHADPDDPLLRQVLPLDAEQTSPEGYVTDPLQEAQHTARRGLIHKYAGRVLLITSPACAINCRYCFRRHFPYQENAPSRSQWDDTLDYLREELDIPVLGVVEPGARAAVNRTKNRRIGRAPRRALHRAPAQLWRRRATPSGSRGRRRAG